MLLTGIDSLFIGLIPVITSSFIEEIGNLGLRKVLLYGSAFLGAVCCILLFEYLSKIVTYRLYHTICYEIKNDIFHGISNLGIKQFSKNDTGFYIGALTEDVHELYDNYFESVFGFFEAGIQIAVYFAYMIYLNPVLSMVILVFSVISVVIPGSGGKKLARLKIENSNAKAAYIGRVKELFSSYLLLDRFTKPAFQRRHDEMCLEREEAGFRFQKKRSGTEIWVGLFLYLINVATFVTGILLINYGHLTAGSFVGLLSFIDVLIIPIRDASFLVVNYKAAGELKKKAEDMIAVEPAYIPEIGSFRNAIVLRNVCYSYKDFDLKDVSLTFEKGKKYAITGKSGSGKSTLLKLIGGQLTPQKGNILIDKKDIANCDTETLFAYINQSAIIFDAGGLDNVTVFGSYDEDGAGALVESLDAGELLKDDFGESGDKISGGEKNKIALLRALCKHSSVLLCDEMFAALDKKSKKRISEFLFALKDLTIISITHDIDEDLLGFYDVIITMDKGRVVNCR